MFHPTPADIDRIRSSFDALWPVSDRTVSTFYDHLFEAAPQTRALFTTDMDEQKRKFLATLATIVGTLDRPAILLPAAESLARHHVRFGVEKEHYALVGDALLRSLAEGLGTQWTAETADAWSRTYTALSDHMIRQAYA